jgi:hypothetical protein
MTLFQAQPKEHLSFAKHLTAEVKTEEFLSGKGLVTKWERLRRSNHWLNALCNACAAGHLCGVRLLGGKLDHSHRHPGRAASSLKQIAVGVVDRRQFRQAPPRQKERLVAPPN